MKKVKYLILASLITILGLHAFAEDKPTKPKTEITLSKYSIDVKITNIPPGQQTLFIPVMIDTMVLDFDKVALEGLSTQNILAVASSSKDKVGPGIGLIKIDDKGLPNTLDLKVLLKKTGEGQTSVSLQKVAEGQVLPSRGTILSEGVSVNLASENEIEVTENQQNNKKKLALNHNKVTVEVHRNSQKEESIFVPLIFDNTVFDIDETFGHAIIAPGIAAKSFGSGSLGEEGNGGPGVEILLTDVADKDFSIDVDLVPRKPGKAKLIAAFPQKGHAALVSGPVVEINPTAISVGLEE
ncbi:MAG: hypothetical protein A3B68_06100 [Candidatus Melainabacteria bacterium RIFCSPHIGHO2_02_FULL_34_12]|nr:MAG: hypothetical protein A3B68_06100 [Candidatus Melainabacteria bacterium RIFCSPHIGHO2_02_FULL_34_12]